MEGNKLEVSQLYYLCQDMCVLLVGEGVGSFQSLVGRFAIACAQQGGTAIGGDEFFILPVVEELDCLAIHHPGSM